MSKDSTRSSQMDQNLVLGLNSSQSRSNHQNKLLEEDSRYQAVCAAEATGHVRPIDQRVPPAIHQSASSVANTEVFSTVVYCSSTYHRNICKHEGGQHWL
jgi:hypothetical protein